MFWKIKTKEYTELLDKINVLSTRIAGLEIDLQLYVKKLRASKGFRDLKEEKPESKGLNKSVLLDSHGQPLSPSGLDSGG